MARSKSAATQAVEPEDDDFGFDLSDGEVVAPGIDLRGKVKERKLQRGEKDPVAQAEAAMKRLETTFGIWIADETEKLLSAWKQAANTSFDAASREALFRSAHDIKGQAATLGYPAAGRVAASLCMLLDHAATPDLLPDELVRQHVQAIRAIVIEDARDESSQTAVRLADRLTEVTDEYLNHIGRGP
ncbi:Hpt domain-containing protein [Prosthecomicrobium hirschii]|uniref:Hpt domain-containing protein n=1 Tax=Prosthecodimorpha hirschii TaxID=665126 RepID=UPI00221F2738|nr:Hpt domain-containing protein [Prosthecomicrobium hirschii]MCW1838503.1 Hpt domain-containing protein [Prosthecomicrobium hirschii]